MSLPYLAAILIALLLAAQAPAHADVLEQARQCALNVSRLERLNCYDALFRKPAAVRSPDDPRSAHWHAAEALERTRGEGFAFLVERQDNGEVLMSAAALGTTPPRPRLVISCNDFITRFQLHSHTPLTEGRAELRLTTPHVALEQTWRIRNGGHVIDGGRGLPAIDTLRRLLSANALNVSSNITQLDGLRFDLDDLRARIQPLREACRW